MFSWLKKIFSSLKKLLNPDPETPEEIIRRTIAEIRTKMPEINVHISRARDGKLNLTEKINSLCRQKSLLNRELESADWKADEIAVMELKSRIRELENSIVTQTGLREQADQDYHNMVRLKTTYEARIREKVARALSSLQRAKAARMREEFLGLANSLGIAGDLLGSETLQTLDNATNCLEAHNEIQDSITPCRTETMESGSTRTEQSTREQI
ncbi:MAG: hypothetical protein CVV64_15545 [Candidatus Wallbacteria bacterium HGW-Wallbacteria-1]|jgi:chromosome segregation ATPase|uniref:PspA/IM30 family protein n=1 Tax=Candidatus Wallbacteria bacterium HGW-Wallbacteria-1 TaxID=2013854 RepID=A0A2N1PLM2_9BACT|nr:MAG: hypothetical protein CVV64_15545 [Candidatus Wallbacteria bacterium HGW-Wallbacteria-1]